MAISQSLSFPLWFMQMLYALMPKCYHRPGSIFHYLSLHFIFTTPPPQLNFPFVPVTSSLVLASSCLASLQLIKIPPTDRQAALVLVHALSESIDIVLARAWRLIVVRLRGSGLLLLLLYGRGSTTEEAADGMANRGSYRNTTIHKSALDPILGSMCEFSCG